MGQYFIVVNPVKRQYLDPSRFGGQSIKRGGILQRYCGQVVEELVRDAPRDPRRPLGGLWLGDPAIVAGDEAGMPNPAGIITTTPDNPGRNLYRMAQEEFQDISYHAIKMLCDADPTTAAEVAHPAGADDSILIALGQVVFGLGCHNLNMALIQGLGPEWPSRYKAAVARYPDRLTPFAVPLREH